MYRPPQTLALCLTTCTLLATACGAQQRDDSEETVQMKQRAVADIEAERLEARQNAPPPEDPYVGGEEEISVEMFEVRPGQPARAESGLEIHLLSAGPSWAFELNHHGRKTRVEHAGVPLYIEGHAYGHLFVISQLGDAVQATLRTDKEDQELTPEQAFELARRERGTRLGCDGGREETAAQPNGTVVLRVIDSSGTESCRIVVGRHTKQIVDY